MPSGPSWPLRLAFVLLVLLVQSGVAPRSVQQPVPDLGKDLGVDVLDVKELVAEVPDSARERVAAHVGCAPDALAGFRLFTGTVRSQGSAGHTQDLVYVPLGGAAAGARLVFSAEGGRAHEMGLWGALDFDDDPTLRWGTFIEQVRVTGARETGAGVEGISLAMEPARDVAARLKELGTVEDADERLCAALVRQRQVMRRNGMWLGMSRRGRQAPEAAWLSELASEMEDVARLAPDLELVLGPGGPERHAAQARELAARFADMAASIARDPAADLTEPERRASELCASCHRSVNQGDGRKWTVATAELRGVFGLAGTRLHVGFDVAPTLGDHEGVSQEITEKIRAGLLLLEAVRE